MQTKALRLITSEELKKLNCKIVERFGNSKRIVSGTCVVDENEKKRYNIVFSDTNRQHPESTLSKIGEYVKDILGADEVYYFGTKIV